MSFRTLLLAGLFNSQFSGVLDLLSVPSAAAYGLRRLRRGYTGPAIRVRRSSDNAEMDVGFLFNGSLDTGSLLAFVGSGSGYITTWYDQSGNGRHVFRTDSTKQNPIIESSALNTLNGRPAMRMGIGTLASSSFSAAFQQMTVCAVLNPTGTGVSGQRVFAAVAGSASDFSANSAIPIIRQSDTSMQSFLNGAGRIGQNYTAAPMIVCATADAANATIEINGSAASAAYSIQPIGSPTYIAIGGVSAAQGESAFFTGLLPEIVFSGAMSSSDRATLRRNQGSYYGITVA